MSIKFSNETGIFTFTGKLASAKRELRLQIDLLISSFELNGGEVTVCKPAIAYGASFSRNQHPRTGV